ncbi:M28 family peptidase [Panacibacter ginsenosidivorans]|uniref:M28 family peptidase n=1 Tax=Panacibacter ginsenosidivorans TaxID=1813871 RepID=A0A5B8VAY2_9BACT|nr:M28 family peptidase [Panacibacter ginsenosidivorans]QEC67468.1 M28 family peptidase [Panacibacter ginsenosidivorans]
MRKFFIAAALLSTTITYAQSTRKLQKVAGTITAKDLKAKLSVIASAEMEGRETATAGQRKAAAYIENYFKQLGLQTGNGDSYQMQFPVLQDSVTSSSFAVNGKSFEPFKEYALSPFSMNTGNWNTDSVVFISFGIVDSTRNDFKSIDVKDKWVIVAEGKAEDADKPAGAVQYSFRNPASVYVKMVQAKANGAKGLIVVTKDFPKKATPVKSNMYLKKNQSTNIPMVYVSYNVASTLLGRSLQSFADLKNIAAAGFNASVALSATTVTNNLQSTNVLGVLPGTDKKDEYVFVTGHYDHLGKRDSVIYYGADDDGSGTTSVLEIAETFAKAKQKGYAPRRTIVFMTVSGEEKGLWGSEYYTSHPVYPLNKTTVDLNIDMVGRIDPDRKYGDSLNYVYTIGEDKLSSDLFKISDSINNKFAKLELDRKYNDPKDPNRFYYRSDHYNFAKNGVPVIFYFNGTHADYHQPTDTVDKINFDLMAKRVKLVFYTAWAMASRDEMLKRDIPLK